MSFEEFESIIWENECLIVAMNHYTLNHTLLLYCVVMHRSGTLAIKGDGNSATEVFQEITNKLLNEPFKSKLSEYKAKKEPPVSE